MAVKTEFAWCLKLGWGPLCQDDYKYQEKQERDAFELIKQELELELTNRIKNHDLDVYSFGIFINDTLEPFQETFEIYRGLRSNVIDYCRSIYFKYCHMVYMYQIEHSDMLEEVLNFGHIRDIKQQMVWQKHWDIYLNKHKKQFELGFKVCFFCYKQFEFGFKAFFFFFLF